MKNHISQNITALIAAAALLVSAPDKALALSPQSKANDRIIEQSVFVPLTNCIHTNQSGTVTAIANPFDLEHFALNINGQNWNPIKLVLEAYRRGLKKFEINPEESAMFMKIQGSSIYTGSTRHSSDIDMMLGNTTHDMPLEEFKPVFTAELKKLLDTTLPPSSKMVFLKYHNEIQALDIDLLLPGKDVPRKFQLNFVFVDKGPPFFAEQKKLLLMKCFFDAMGRPAKLNGIVGKQKITRELLEDEAEKIFASARTLAQKAITALTAPEEKPFEETVTDRHLFAIKERYLAWKNLAKQETRFSSITFNHTNVPVDNNDPELRRYAMEFFRDKLAKKVLEAAVIAGERKIAAATLAMMDEARFDLNFLVQSAQSLFGPKFDGRPEALGIISHEIKSRASEIDKTSAIATST